MTIIYIIYIDHLNYGLEYDKQNDNAIRCLNRKFKLNKVFTTFFIIYDLVLLTSAIITAIQSVVYLSDYYGLEKFQDQNTSLEIISLLNKIVKILESNGRCERKNFF